MPGPWGVKVTLYMPLPSVSILAGTGGLGRKSRRWPPRGRHGGIHGKVHVLTHDAHIGARHFDGVGIKDQTAEGATLDVRPVVRYPHLPLTYKIPNCSMTATNQPAH